MPSAVWNLTLGETNWSVTSSPGERPEACSTGTRLWQLQLVSQFYHAALWTCHLLRALALRSVLLILASEDNISLSIWQTHYSHLGSNPFSQKRILLGQKWPKVSLFHPFQGHCLLTSFSQGNFPKIEFEFRYKYCQKDLNYCVVSIIHPQSKHGPRLEVHGSCGLMSLTLHCWLQAGFPLPFFEFFPSPLIFTKQHTSNKSCLW